MTATSSAVSMTDTPVKPNLNPISTQPLSNLSAFTKPATSAIHSPNIPLSTPVSTQTLPILPTNTPSILNLDAICTQTTSISTTTTWSTAYLATNVEGQDAQSSSSAMVFKPVLTSTPEDAISKVLTRTFSPSHQPENPNFELRMSQGIEYSSTHSTTDDQNSSVFELDIESPSHPTKWQSGSKSGDVEHVTSDEFDNDESAGETTSPFQCRPDERELPSNGAASSKTFNFNIRPDEWAKMCIEIKKDRTRCMGPTSIYTNLLAEKISTLHGECVLGFNTNRVKKEDSRKTKTNFWTVTAYCTFTGCPVKVLCTMEREPKANEEATMTCKVVNFVCHTEGETQKTETDWREETDFGQNGQGRRAK